MTIPAWARDFNNAPRHCWIDKTGQRYIDPSQLD